MDIARRRLRNQGLVGTGLGDPAEVVRRLGAVQSQDYPAAKWALAQRLHGWDNLALDRAFDAGAILRTHVLRPTWHFVAPEDLRWLLALTGPRVLAGVAFRLRQLELDDDTLRRAQSVVVAALEGGQARTRQEMGAALDAAGISTAGQRLPWILSHAELTGVVCSGPLRGRTQTYALIEERVPPAPARPRDEALAELVRRYFASHGPATVHDIAWWSGLTAGDAKRGLEAIRGDAEPATIDGTVYWMADAGVPAGPARNPAVHLLPNFDELTVAYRNHDPSFDPRAREALAGTVGAVLTNVVAVNGLVVGHWRRSVTRSEVVIRPEVKVALSEPERAGFAAAAKRYGRFLGLSAAVDLARVRT